MTVLLEGNVALISLFNLLQFVRLEQKTCLMEMEIKEINQQAKMYFHIGNLIYAELNLLEGAEAMYRLICWWNMGHFSITEVQEADLPSPNIHEPLESVLLESARFMDECAAFRMMLPSLKSAVTFSSAAIAAIQDNQLPEFTQRLPSSFNIARYFEISPYGHWDACGFLKEMIKANGLLVADEDNPNAPQGLTPIDSLESIVMEFIGIQDCRALIEDTLNDLNFTRDQKLGFNQLLSIADRLVDHIREVLQDDDKTQEAMYRLRARITSLV